MNKKNLEVLVIKKIDNKKILICNKCRKDKLGKFDTMLYLTISWSNIKVGNCYC